MNFIHEQSCGHICIYNGCSDIDDHKYLSTAITLDWPKSNIITRFFATITCTTISGHPRHGGFNIRYHGTHVVEFLYNLLHLSKVITPTLHPYYGLYLDLSSSTHQWRSGSPLWIPIHVNNLQNKSFIPSPLPMHLIWNLGSNFTIPVKLQECVGTV